MKATKWAIALLLGFGALLSACTKDTVNDPDTDPNPEPTGTAYFSFGFSNQQDTKTRSYNPGEEAGTKDEEQVALIWMLLYDTDGILKYAYELDACNVNESDESQLVNFYGTDVSSEGAASTDGFRTVGKKVAAQDYQLVILVNPIYFSQGYLSGFTESKGVKGEGIKSSDLFYNLSTLLDVNQGDGDFDYGTTVIGSSAYIWPANGIGYGENGTFTTGNLFFMSNGNGVIDVPISSLRESQEEAEKNPSAGVNVDRLFAKIMVNERSDIPTPVLTGGSLQSLTYGLKNRNKYVYPIRLFANVFDGTKTNCEGAMETVNTDRKYMYAEDPNFGDTQNTSEFLNSFAGEFVSWNTRNSSSGSVEENNWIYSPENTMPLSIQASDDWADYTTQVHIKAIIYYAFPTVDASNSYYSWLNTADNEWVLFTFDMAKDWMANGFPAAIDDLKYIIGYTNESTTFVKGSSSFFNVNSVAAATRPIATSNNTPALTTDNAELTYHHRGFNQYYIPVKHFEGQYSDAELDRKGVYGHYGIVRNNVYRVTINSINGPGTPLNDGWISSDIKINGWYTRPGQIEDL